MGLGGIREKGDRVESYVDLSNEGDEWLSRRKVGGF